MIGTQFCFPGKNLRWIGLIIGRGHRKERERIVKVKEKNKGQTFFRYLRRCKKVSLQIKAL
ncbi:Hypothetical protein Minf_0112 [Methylacidiphilum infernorum V4]|uniref:Uncharacterized protein n=1 Tax=Methylacidiphilum infernorum (isolate V4) TaxID=481448 RepID=B3DX32_METI4|nr:Hypothetical protein Minf_0112 [Methylacidiphilum infernorum V4]